MRLVRAARVAATFVVGLAAVPMLAADESAVGASPPQCRGWTATMVGSGDADKLIGTPGPDVIVGRGGEDEINGRGGGDLICAGGGADVVRGGRGNDALLGGPGDDRVGYETARRGVTVKLDAGRAHGQGRDRLISLEGFQGSRFGDTVRGTSGSNLLLGKGGDDALFGGRGPNFLVGGPGADRLVGLRGSNTMLGYGGDDVVVAGPRKTDWLDGGRGRDRIEFRTSDGVSVDLSTGRVSSPDRARVWAFEIVVGTGGGDRIQGSGRPERIYGRGGSDYLTGGERRDLVGGGSGFDICFAETERGCEL